MEYIGLIMKNYYFAGFEFAFAICLNWAAWCILRSFDKSFQSQTLIEPEYDKTKNMCAQRRLRSACTAASVWSESSRPKRILWLAWATIQSDQRTRCPPEGLGFYLPVKAQQRLTRLDECPGWPESSPGAHVANFVLFCFVVFLFI